jgi:hypothetical protein
MLKSGGAASGGASLLILGGAATEKIVDHGTHITDGPSVPPQQITVAGEQLNANSAAYKTGGRGAPVELKQEQNVAYALISPYGGSYVPITECISDTPTNKARKKIGVGEEVKILWKPDYPYAAHPIRWGAINGSVQIGAWPLFTAGESAGAGKAIANLPYDNPTKHFPIVFEVVTPTGIIAEKTNEAFNIGFGIAGAHMRMNVTLQPTDVSFYNVLIKEIGKNASDISGYFTSHPPLSHIGHGADIWHRAGPDNVVDLAVKFDTAEYYGSALLPAPWAAGHFQWEIPTVWAVVGSTRSFTLPGWTAQVFDLANDGTMTITKLGNSVTRPPSAP